jgi:AraC-like DNA-binding protein
MGRRRVLGDERAIGTIWARLTREVASSAIASGATDPTLAEVADDQETERHTIERHFAIWELAMRKTNTPAFPVRVGRSTTVERYGVFGYGLYLSRTVAEALRRTARYYHVINDSGRYRIDTAGNEVAIVFDRPGPRTLGMRVANEQVLVATATLLARYIGDVPPFAVQFRHPRPADTSEHEQVFRASVKFDAPLDAIVVPKAFLDQPNKTHDTVLEPYFLKELDEAAQRVSHGHGFASNVSKAILSRLSDGIPRASAIAREVASTERTLRRRLAETGTSYAELVAALQRDRAETMLKQGVPIGVIALAVGFTDAAAFTRAFRRWTGMPPSAAREGIVPPPAAAERER